MLGRALALLILFSPLTQGAVVRQDGKILADGLQTGTFAFASSIRCVGESSPCAI